MRQIAIAAMVLLMSASAYAQSDGIKAATDPAAGISSPTQRDTTLADLDAYPTVRDELKKGNLPKAFKLLQAQEPLHENDPNYFNLVGILAMKTRDYAAAASALERVVIMQPDNAGAWMDLAIADAEIGNFVSAQGYFDHIESAFEPPSGVREVIAGYRLKIAGKAKELSPWRFYVQTVAGIDSNANSGIQNSSIPLTFGGDRVELPLDPSYQPRKDNFAQIGLSGSYRWQSGDNRFEAAGGIRKRSYTVEHDFSTLEMNVGLTLQRPTAIGDASVSVQAEHISLGSTALFRNFHAIAQIERSVGNCRVALNTEMEWRRYVSLTHLDGNVVWGQLGVGCEWTIADLKTQATLIARIGEDTPTGARPGGRTARRDLVAQVSVPLPWNITTELSLTIATSQDANGYSPLLEANSARRLQRRNARLLVSVPFTTSAELFFVAENNRFESNLALFQQNGKSISVGLKQRF